MGIPKAKVKRKHTSCYPLGSILKNIRQEKKLTIREVGYMANVHPNTVYRAESGLNKTSLYIVEKIAAVLGYEIELMEIQDGNPGSKS